MPAITLTCELARAAATDAGNRRMRFGGRARWDEEDYNEACDVFNRLMGMGVEQEAAAPVAPTDHPPDR